MLPQHHFLRNKNGELAVSFIGKFENLQEDYSHVCEKLNIPSTTLPVINQSGRQPVLKHFDTELVEMLESVYHQDFKTFNYSNCVPAAI